MLEEQLDGSYRVHDSSTRVATASAMSWTGARMYGVASGEGA